MNKTDLAKMLGVDRCTIWRWQKEGMLKQKVDEHKQISEFAKVNTDIETLKALQRIEELLKTISQKLDVAKGSEKVADSYKVLTEEIKDQKLDVAKGSEKVADSYKVLTEEIKENYTAKELAEVLGVNSRTVRRKVRSGEIKAQKVAGKTGKYVIPGEEVQRLKKAKKL